jgi:hypothetical protein
VIGTERDGDDRACHDLTVDDPGAPRDSAEADDRDLGAAR